MPSSKRTARWLVAIGFSLVALCAACGDSGSTATATSTTVPPATTAPSTGSARNGLRAANVKAASACLIIQGVPAARIAAAFGRVPRQGSLPAVRAQTLQSAGQTCQSTLSPTAVNAIKRLDACITSRGVSMPNTGSALADILLLDPTATNVEHALSACLAQRKD